jgi:Flp pilus assembly protein protease CpaA
MTFTLTGPEATILAVLVAALVARVAYLAWLDIRRAAVRAVRRRIAHLRRAARPQVVARTRRSGRRGVRR